MNNVEAFRKLDATKSNKSNKYVPCIKYNGICKCPGNCMDLVNNNTQCKLKKCYNWNNELSECEKVGPKFVPAIVLQAIPITGVFGSGFGNMGRWDIFSIYMGVVFGPFILLIMYCCCFIIFCSKESESEDLSNNSKCIPQCFGCLWSITILILWIWGIVVIANKEINGPPEPWYNDTVSCSLV